VHLLFQLTFNDFHRLSSASFDVLAVWRIRDNNVFA
ncbi:MAG: hypothetical protein JWR76_2193, partial [Mucilaginibacter sp.]|nr:hypothetical protein [Mucilaginibacter sp.]